MPPGGLHPGPEYLGGHALHRKYQIQRSREEAWSVTISLPGAFQAFPGDVVRLELVRLGLAGEYRVAEVENTASASAGETMTLTLKEWM